MWMLSFHKYQGAGNDFILIDDRKAMFPSNNQTLIQSLCKRRFGIGADGLILLTTDPKADYRMRIFNPDGQETESCGNGLRCLIQFLSDLGESTNWIKIALPQRVVFGSLRADEPSLFLEEPSDVRQKVLQTRTGVWHFANTGVPHAVQFMDNIESVDLVSLAQEVRHHRVFSPYGTNVNIASIQPDGVIQVRTFERGVEGETLSCGTGAVAVAYLASSIYKIPFPIRMHFQGGILQVGYEENLLRLSGPVAQVFQGTVNLNP